MIFLSFITWAVLLASVSDEPPAPMGPRASGRKDVWGDALPPGAMARIGTVRLRHPETINGIVFLRDGRTVVTTAHEHGRFGKTMDVLRFWDVSSGTLLRSIKGDSWGAGQLILTPDGNTLVAANGGANGFCGWDVLTGRGLFQITWDGGGNLFQVALAPDGRTLATFGVGSPVQLWDFATRRPIRQIKARMGIGASLAYSPDGKLLAAGRLESSSGGLTLYDAATGKERWHQPWSAASISFSPEGRMLAVGGGDGIIRLVTTESGEEARSWAAHRSKRPVPFPSQIGALTFAPDGRSIASGERDGSVRIWDVDTGRERFHLVGPIGPVYSIAYSPDGSTLATGGIDQCLRLWDTRTGQEHFKFTGHRHLVRAVAFSRDGKSLATGSSDDTVRLSDPTTGREIWCGRGHRSGITDFSFSPDGRELSSASDDATVRIWEVSTGKLVKTIRGHGSRVYAVSHSPDGTKLATASIDSTVRLWQISTGKELLQMEGGASWGWVTSLSFSPDGLSLASAREDGTVRVTDIASGKELRRLNGPKSRVTLVRFSPDGRTLFSASEDGTVRLWDPTAGNERAALHLQHGPQPRVGSTAISPDGRLVVSGGCDGTVRIFEIASKAEVASFTGHTDEVSRISFAMDSMTAASGSRDYTALVWDITGLRVNGTLPDLHLSLTELEEAWVSLGSADAGKAYRAVWHLTSSPREAVPFLKDRLTRVAAAPKEAVIQRWIGLLDSENFQVRTRATLDLLLAAETAEPLLRRTLTGRVSPEARNRIKDLLERIEAARRFGPGIRVVRAVAALEHMRTPEALRALESLAAGDQSTRLAQEAKASQGRLAKTK
jgi:WD40 repeat protein